MSLINSVPRFLLPQWGAIWRARLPIPASTSITIRNASKVTKQTPKNLKPLVLEKPAKFNPPSHGSRLRKEPPRYPGPQLSAEEAARRETKKYPHLMPPPGTFMHWFLNSRSIHIYITLVSPARAFQLIEGLTIAREHSSHLQQQYSLRISNTTLLSRTCYLIGRNYLLAQ